MISAQVLSSCRSSGFKIDDDNKIKLTIVVQLFSASLFAKVKRSRSARHQVVYNASADNALSHITARHNVSVTTLPGTVFCWLSTQYLLIHCLTLADNWADRYHAL